MSRELHHNSIQVISYPNTAPETFISTTSMAHLTCIMGLLPHPCPVICVIAPSMSHLTSKQVLKKFHLNPNLIIPSMPRYLGLTSFHLPRFTCITQHHPDHISLPCRFSRSCNLHLNSIQIPSHINPGVDICISSPSRSIY